MSARSVVQPGEVERGGSGSLRDAALRSGAYLMVREAVGVVIRLGGLVLVMRRIGPADFGVYSAAAAYVLFPTTLAQMGAEVFLVRQPGPLARRTYDEVFTVLLVTSGVVVGAGLGLSFVVAPWLRPFGVIGPMRVLLLGIPVNILWAPYQAAIERKFAYRRMGALELGGDVALYATAVPLALLGYGAWSLVAGFFAWQTLLLVGSMALSGLRPRLAWSARTARAVLAHGGTYSITTWIQGVRSAVLALIVGTYAGATGVGLMNFAVRLVTTMNIGDRGVHRVGMVAISKANKDRPDRMAAALEEGTLLLLVVTALPLAAFGLMAHWVIPDVFGRDWLPALPVYVLLALWAMLRVPVTVQRTLLYAYGHNVPPAVTSTIELVMVSVVSLVAVRQLGIVGFGIASVVAVSSTVYTHYSAHRLVAVRYRRLIVPLVGLVPPVFVALAPLPWSLLLLLPPVILVANPATRRELAHLTATARATIGGRRGRTLRDTGRRTTPPVPTIGGVARVQVATALRRHGGLGVEMALNGSSPHAWEPVASRYPAFTAWQQDGHAEVSPEHEAVDVVDVPGTVQAPVAQGSDLGGLAVIGAQAGAGDLSGSGSGSGSADQLAELLAESDPVTGLPSAAVLLARLGRLLGAARDPGWELCLVVVHLARSGGTGPLAAPSEEQLARIATALRGELRFDDIVARVGPRTFVAAVLLVAGAAEASGIAAHLESSARAAMPPAAAGPAAVRASTVVVHLPCDGQADLLVRQALEAVRG
jgi:O-antigen/teichoic acid export membrane protein/GGDEF domain-containing protein